MFLQHNFSKEFPSSSPIILFKLLLQQLPPLPHPRNCFCHIIDDLHSVKPRSHSSDLPDPYLILFTTSTSHLSTRPVLISLVHLSYSLQALVRWREHTSSPRSHISSGLLLVQQIRLQAGPQTVPGCQAGQGRPWDVLKQPPYEPVLFVSYTELEMENLTCWQRKVTALLCGFFSPISFSITAVTMVFAQ